MTLNKGELGARITRARGLVWPILVDLGSIDPSSNLGEPTNQYESGLPRFERRAN